MNKKTFIVCSLIVLTGLIIAGTYALFQWNTTTDEETILKVTVQGADIIYEGGTDITGFNLNPTATKEEGVLKELSLSLGNSTINVCADINLELTTLPTGLLHESFRYEIYKNNTLIGEGNFSDKYEGQTIKLATSHPVTSNVDTYKIYLWIDGENYNNPSEMQGQDFSFKINVNAVDGATCNPSSINADASGASSPELFDGMIPVKWDSSNAVIKADSTNPGNNLWYNYDAKMWANAVMVTNDTRETYMNASAGTQITESDVLAYWVWIPRYRYELFNATFESGTVPQTINIEFESATTEKSTGKIDDVYMNYEWYTHPAFSFGTEEGGYTELSGFWVAKFEPTGNATVGNLTVLPGVASLRSISVGNAYAASRLFSNTAYLTVLGSIFVDAHMMKNTEWGAVAFLSHSVYGKNAEITINNNGDSYYTGGAAGNAYLTNVVQSTTGNVYGVYDMSGNALEYVMGNYNNSTGSSGLAVENINGKYVDIYIGDSVGSSIMGDAVGETAGWYGDSLYFVTLGAPWFSRGGHYSYDTDSSQFSFDGITGGAYDDFSFRPVLSAK